MRQNLFTKMKHMNIRLLFTAILMLALSLNGFAQGNGSQGNTTANWIDNSQKNLMIGGYGEVHYNQGFDKDIRKNAKLDVHRLVMLFGYNFTKKLSFLTEIEFEHVKELYVEQAFVNYKYKDYLQFRGGLLLVPMGIINEYHEPTTFYGVERPFVDNVIVPTTWREIGLGIAGNIKEASLRYQLYLVNGFLGYDGAGKFSGSKGFRSGRQKGAESIMSAPNLSTKLNYYGVRGLNVGLALYTGKSQSTLYNGLDKNDEFAKAQADSSSVYLTMVGLDARYDYKALHVRGQLNFNSVGNSDAYNAFTGQDVGSQMLGYYLEAGYNLFQKTEIPSKLIPFIRYEKYNTHLATADEGVTKNDAYNRTAITTGLNWRLSDGVAVKTDFQFFKSKAADDWDKQLNIGFGVWFR